MATTFKVSDTYNTVCSALLEPFQDGLYPGLTLGIVTEAQFLVLFAAVLEDFINRSGLVWSIFTQQIQFGISQYMQPNAMNSAKVAFVGGVYIDHSTLADLDDWKYDWRGKAGTPEYWHSDGLPPKTVEMADMPNYSGASYALANPADPTAQPPYGIYGLFNGTTQGQVTGVLNVAGTAGTWGAGALFDMRWNNYSPAPNILLNGAAWPIQTVTDAMNLVFAVPPGDGIYNFAVNIGNDGNLTLIGTTGLNSITYTLDEIIPVIPDSFAAVYLAYGVLARIFSNDSECKDLQRAYYCQARYMEGVNAAAAISGEMLEING